MDIRHNRAIAALVTGASAGIGREFAGQLASRGHPLVLVARRGGRLRELATQLGERHSVPCLPVTADLSEPEVVETLWNAAREADLNVGWLINNAGYGLSGKFLASDWPIHASYAQLMMMTPLQLVYRFAPSMLERRFGRIINVASLAGLVPSSAGHTLYGGTKAFLIRVSEALNAEYSAHGVHVCASCPGFTKTEFHDVTGTRDQVAKMPRYMWQNAEAVVAESIRAVEAGRARVVTGRVNKLIAGITSTLPYGLVTRLVSRRAHQFRKT